MSQDSLSLKSTTSPASSILCSLSRMDNFNNGNPLTVSVIINCPGAEFDESIYQAAVERAINKNRIFAGRVQKEKIDNLFQILVPLGELPEDYKLFDFACQTIDKSIDYPHLSSSDGQFVEQLPRELYKPAAFPQYLASLAETDSPLISILCSKFKNITTIGINVNHAFLDGGGLMMLSNAINEELDQSLKKSEPIPLSEENLLQKNYREITELKGVGVGEAPLREICKKTFISTSKWIVNWLWEYYWHGSRVRTIYIGRDLLAKVVSGAKAEASLEGTFVSTPNILMAWLLKTIYSAEKPSSKIVVSSSAVTIRSLFGLKSYPHNAMTMAAIPLLATTDIVANSISKTALEFKKGADASLSKEFVRDYMSLLPTLASVMLRVEPNLEIFTFSNQTMTWDWTNYTSCRRNNVKKERVTVIGWGGWSSGLIQIENLLTYYESLDPLGGKGNFNVSGRLRKNRWNAIEKEVKRMRDGI